MTRFFITRPIFASVLSIIIVLAGLVAALQLPIAQYPQIAPPTVLITATFPGASAETLTKTVAAPIEEQLSGVEDLLYFSSSSDSSGTLTITATFEVGTDIDQATFNISNRVNIALPRLPDEVRRTGLIVQKRSNDILLVAMLISKEKGKYDPLFLSNYVTLNVLDELKRTKGVGESEFWVHRTIPCASGCVPIAWRNWASPQLTSLRLSRRKTRNMPRARSGRNRHRRISS